MARARAGDRHTKSVSLWVIRDAKKRAVREAKNALRQFDLAVEIVNDWLRPSRRFRLLSSQILQLHKTAMDGVHPLAGTYRNGPANIGLSKHKPPDAFLVPSLMEEMCDYVNKNQRRNAIHLCAYVMWRMNWIHPFADGNGRTSRAAAYLVLCVRLGYELPGRFTIPEQIAADKDPYYDALETADIAWRRKRVDVSRLEKLLSAMLAKQLLGVHDSARGKGRAIRRRKFH